MNWPFLMTHPPPNGGAETAVFEPGLLFVVVAVAQGTVPLTHEFVIAHTFGCLGEQTFVDAPAD
jgi:hypothetical protein